MNDSPTSFTHIRRERDRKRKKAEIIDEAEKIFRKKGFLLATTDEIARESGYSVGTLYNLFGDKEGLYAEVLEGIGRALLARLEGAVLSKKDPETAIESLIKLRLCNYTTDRLFFQPFSCEGDVGIQPDPDHLPKRLVNLYHSYLDAVSALFRQLLKREGIRDLNPEHLAISLEGIINAFMGYWSRPEQSGSLDQVARHIKGMLLSPVAPGRAVSGADAVEEEPAVSRQIHMNRYDIERLEELIIVARGFGRPDRRAHLDTLSAWLEGAIIDNPREVPDDVITMNSRVRLRNLETDQEEIILLVFPKDANSAPENLSILAPLGTVTLGQRVGDVFEAPLSEGTVRYRVEELLYQPEAAGDYHL